MNITKATDKARSMRLISVAVKYIITRFGGRWDVSRDSAEVAWNKRDAWPAMASRPRPSRSADAARDRAVGTSP